MSTMPLVAPCAVIFNAFKYIQRLPHHTLTTQNLPFTDIFASPNGFWRPNVNVAIVQTQSLRAAQTFTHMESTVHRHRDHRFASFFVSQNGNVNILATERQKLPSLLTHRLLGALHGATHRHHRKGPALFQRDRPQQVPQGDPRRLYLRHPHHHLLVHLLPGSLGPQHLGFLLAR